MIAAEPRGCDPEPSSSGARRRGAAADAGLSPALAAAPLHGIEKRELATYFLADGVSVVSFRWPARM